MRGTDVRAVEGCCDQGRYCTDRFQRWTDKMLTATFTAAQGNSNSNASQHPSIPASQPHRRSTWVGGGDTTARRTRPDLDVATSIPMQPQRVKLDFSRFRANRTTRMFFRPTFAVWLAKTLTLSDCTSKFESLRSSSLCETAPPCKKTKTRQPFI